VWGDGKQSAFIYLGERTLSITETLRSALLYIRDRESETRIWMDQVYINQRSVGERNEQVSTMGEVHEKAELVITWLDEATPATHYIVPALYQVDDSTATPSEIFRENQLQSGYPI
jgi:hypothetical protein